MLHPPRAINVNNLLDNLLVVRPKFESMHHNRGLDALLKGTADLFAEY